jgi:cysteine synthase A
VKDRAAKYLIEGLERDGKLRSPGDVVVEGTAGNTGIGLTYVANSKGYRSVIVIPRTQTQEKKDTLRQAGAVLVEVDAKPYSNENNYIKLSGRLAEALPNACWAQQFDNTDNRRAHIEGKNGSLLFASSSTLILTVMSDHLSNSLVLQRQQQAPDRKLLHSYPNWMRSRVLSEQAGR